MNDLFDDARRSLQDHYALRREIARGSKAVVLLADELKHGRTVAIKILSPELSASIDGDRFRREIQIAARLSHPHILPIFDSGSAGGSLYYTMPFVEGESLRQRIERERQLSLADTVAIACEVDDALAYAHTRGVIHRDIKPDNILLHGGHAVVADFGIARILDDTAGEKLTQTGISLGTAAYMSPEQFDGAAVDARADIYSLGCVVYEMLVGQPPFTGPNAAAIIARHAIDVPPPIGTVRELPPGMETVVMRALKKVPADRFDTALQFKDALRLSVDPAGAHVASGRATARVRTGMRPRVVAAAVALCGLAGLGYYAASHRTGSTAVSTTKDSTRLAVLYFDAVGGDSSLRFVADGLTEALIARLGQESGISVVSSGGVYPYRSKPAKLDTVGRRLNVGTVVHGNVEQQGTQYRVSVAVADAQNGADVAQKSFSIDRKDVLTASDSLFNGTKELLKTQQESKARAKRAEAWTLIQQAKSLTKRAEELTAKEQVDSAARALREADALATRAARVDPSWAEPLVQCGVVRDQRVRLADSTMVSALADSAHDCIGRSLAMEPRNPEALATRGALNFYRVSRGAVAKRDQADLLTAAERDLRDALGIDPRQALANHTLALLQYSKQAGEAALILDAKAYETDSYTPAATSQLARLFAINYDFARFSEATKWCTEGFRRFPENPRFSECQLNLMVAPSAPPNPDAAWAVARRVETLYRAEQRPVQRSVTHMFVAVVLGRANLLDSAHKVIETARLDDNVDVRDEVLGFEAVARALLGEREIALDKLERMLARHPEHRAGFGKVNMWWWRSVQQDPRFRRLTNRR